MRFDIARIENPYRGFERVLLATDLLTKKGKKCFEDLFERYCTDAVDVEIQGAYDPESFEKMLAFYQRIKEYDVACEFIVYDDVPVETAFGHALDFLGIDIGHEMAESLLNGSINPEIQHLLNENGLCRCEADVAKIIPFQDHGGIEWTPCYVYKLRDF